MHLRYVLGLLALSFLILSGCTRATEDSGSKVVISSQSVSTLATPIPAGYTACYALNVIGPDIPTFPNTCHPEVGFFEGFYNLGGAAAGTNQSMEILVPFGPDRKVELLAYLVPDGSICPFWDLFSTDYNNVFRVAEATNVNMFEPEVTLVMNVDFPGMANNVHTTDSLTTDCSANGGVPANQPPSDLDYNVDVFYGFDSEAFSVPPPSFAGGGTPVFTVAPSLPAGVTMNPLTGAVSGTYVGTLPKTTYTVTVTTEFGNDDTQLDLEIARKFVVDQMIDDVNADDAALGNGVCFDAGGRGCTLRSAMGEIIALGSGNYHILLPTGTINLFAALPDVTMSGREMHVIGAGQGVTFIDGGSSHQAFNLSGTGTALVIGNMTVQNAAAPTNAAGINATSGSVHIFDTYFYNNVNSAGNGGAISYSGPSALTIENSHFEQNDASAGNGGAIWFGSGGILEVDDTILELNTASGNGGAIFLGAGTSISIEESHFDSNTGSSGGGAIHVGNPTATYIERTSFEGNNGGGVGGALNVGMPGGGNVLEIENCSFQTNTASTDGLSIYNSSSTGDTITLTNNSFGDVGTQNMIENGGADPIIFRNNILRNTVGNDCGSGTYNSDGGNLSSDSTCSFANTNDIQSVDPGFITFSIYGVQRAWQIGSGSSAYQNGLAAWCPFDDATGFIRTAPCDSGAYEVD